MLYIQTATVYSIDSTVVLVFSHRQSNASAGVVALDGHDRDLPSRVYAGGREGNTNERRTQNSTTKTTKTQEW